jgi:hypothetical protein
LETKYTNWNEQYEKLHEYIASTQCYIISKQGIDKINKLFTINEGKYSFNIDKSNDKLRVADKFLYKHTNTYVYQYNYITSDSKDSIIHNDHLKWHKQLNKQDQYEIISNILLNPLQADPKSL